MRVYLPLAMASLRRLPELHGEPLVRLFGEVERRTRGVDVFPHERSAVRRSSTVMLRVPEGGALRRSLGNLLCVTGWSR